MGRFPNIAASKAKTGAQKAKVYSGFAKEIYQTAKNGGTDPSGNLNLRRLIEKAKKEQVPSDVINRAIEKARGEALQTPESMLTSIGLVVTESFYREIRNGYFQYSNQIYCENWF